MDEQMQRKLVVLSTLIDRLQLASSLGQQFGGDRKLYEILGYPVEITFGQYMAKYTRQDIAGKVVDLPAIDTWRKPPVISDGNGTTAEDQPGSLFIQGLKTIIDQRRLWHYLSRVDRLAGIGRYGVLMLGIAGVSDLSQPLEAGSLKSPQDLIYLSAFSEESAEIKTKESDAGNARYGLPSVYELDFGDGKADQPVHWSRVIHVADDLLEDDIYGRPRLERIYNRLDDMEKITGGGAEATWKVMDRGLQADIRDDYTGDTQTLADLETEIDEYLHGLRRFIRTQGVDIKDLGSAVVDPSGLYNILIGLIAAASDIPQRILIGSERGELASSQDAANWAGSIAARQQQYAEPVILRPFIDRLVMTGALPKAEGDKYRVEWSSLFEQTEKEKLEVADLAASAISKVAPGGQADLIVTPDEFREKYLGLEPNMQAEVDAVLDEEDVANV